MRDAAVLAPEGGGVPVRGEPAGNAPPGSRRRTRNVAASTMNVACSAAREEQAVTPERTDGGGRVRAAG